MPTVATELSTILARLEREFGDVQDVEFTIEEDGKFGSCKRDRPSARRAQRYASPSTSFEKAC